MASFGRAYFIALNGTPPAELGLEPLSTARPTQAVVEATFSRFLGGGFSLQSVTDLEALPGHFSTEPVLVYLMGHAWLEDGHYTTAINAGGVDRILSGEALLNLLRPLMPGRALVIVDTCYAAAFGRELSLASCAGVTAIFASGANESAVEFPADSATRFSIALRSVIGRSRNTRGLDMIEVALAVRAEINRPNLLVPQSVEYWVGGPPFVLDEEPRTEAGPGQRAHSRTYLLLRAALVATGAVLTVGLTTALIYYRSHFRLEVGVSGREPWTASGTLSVRRQDPDSNLDIEIERLSLPSGSVVRLDLPSSDLIVAVTGSYEDQLPRAISFHLKQEAG